jgi:hypothetical protein
MVIQIWTLTTTCRGSYPYVGGENHIPVLLFLTQTMKSQRMKALPGELARCKVSVMTQAAAEITETLPFGQLQPYGDHFHPIRITGTPKEGPLEPRGFGSPHAALTATPKVDQVRNSPFG